MNLFYGGYPDLSRVNRILVIKLRHLGDVLLSGPVFSNLRKRFPEAEIDAYVWKEAASILEGHSGVSGIVEQDRSWKGLPFLGRVSKELSLLREIRSKGYDLVVNLTEGDRGAMAMLASGARVRVGVDPGKKGFLGKRRAYTHFVKSCPGSRHTVERDLDALRRIGIFPGESERELELSVPEGTREAVLKLLEGYGLDKGGFTLIHPVSRWRFKCLPAERMAQVADLLDGPVVLSGGPSEQEWEMNEEIVRAASGKVINLAGMTSLKELGALMLMAKGLITVDSVALHMGSALKVPLVALFGPTSEENWGPWLHPRGVVVAQNRVCRPCRLDGCGGSKMSDCLWTLSPQRIVDAYNRVSTSDDGLFVLQDSEY